MRQFAWTTKQKPIPTWNIVRDDKVIVLSGKYKKQTGIVLKVLKNKNKVIVKDVNLKFITIDDEEGTGKMRKVIKKEAPIHVSNVALIDPETQ